MASEWKKLSLRLNPRVHYAIMELSPNPTRAMRHLLNCYAKKLVEEHYKEQGDLPRELDIDFEEIDRNDPARDD
mgnify:CR=1 FL=1